MHAVNAMYFYLVCQSKKYLNKAGRIMSHYTSPHNVNSTSPNFRIFATHRPAGGKRTVYAENHAFGSRRYHSHEKIYRCVISSVDTNT